MLFSGLRFRRCVKKKKKKKALPGVRTVRRQDGPPLRVAQQLRGLRQQQALCGLRVLPAGVRSDLLLRRHRFSGQRALTGEPI